MQQADLDALNQAAQRLESANLAIRISNLLGVPVEKVMSALPERWSNIVSIITKSALEHALYGALLSLKKTPKKPGNKLHKMLAGISGAIGGAFGIVALAIELPISATIMLRSIADIARSEGENLDDMEAKMACLSVFALRGGYSDFASSKNAGAGYYALRSFLTKSVSETSSFIASHGLSKQGAPALVRLMNAVSVRFSVSVSEKMAAQAMPALGSVGGASVNLLFIEHFQQMAKAHFTVRRLERLYGKELIERTYREIVNKKTWLLSAAKQE